MADLDEIMSGRDPASGDDPSGQEQQPSRRQRDESGRFAAQPQPDGNTPEGQPPEGGEPQPQPALGTVPIQALDKERGEARAAKAEAEQLRRQVEQMAAQLSGFMAAQQRQPAAEPPKAPDWFDDPNAAIQHSLKGAVEPLQQGLEQQREAFSRMMAEDKFGEEAVNTAYAALAQRVQANPAANRWLYDRIMQSRHPYGELVKWHKESSALSEVGEDPQAYRERLRAEIMAEMQGGQPQPQAGQPQQPASPMPTSFAGARNAGPRTAPVWQGPKPLSEIMGGR